jgi:hypothetical protein
VHSRNTFPKRSVQKLSSQNSPPPSRSAYFSFSLVSKSMNSGAPASTAPPECSSFGMMASQSFVSVSYWWPKNTSANISPPPKRPFLGAPSGARMRRPLLELLAAPIRPRRQPPAFAKYLVAKFPAPLFFHLFPKILSARRAKIFSSADVTRCPSSLRPANVRRRATPAP